MPRESWIPGVCGSSGWGSISGCGAPAEYRPFLKGGHPLKRAVVLAGGGSRGAYQIGVWQALRELGIEYHIVTGTSVGALNGAMMVQGDYDLALHLWQQLVTTDVVKAEIDTTPPDYQDAHWEGEVWGRIMRQALKEGGLDFSPLEELMAQYTSEERLRSSPVDFGLVTVTYPSMQSRELRRDQIPEGQLTDFVVASAACFPAFKAKEIGEERYIDGSYQDYMPVNLALSMGAEEVIAVDLKSVGQRRRTRRTAVPVQVIRSHWELGPFLWFEPSLSRRNIRLGYLDALRSFGKLDGSRYALTPGEWTVFLAVAEEAMERLMPLIQLDSALARMGWRRLLQALSMQARHSTPEALLLPAAEEAAALLRLDPLPVYSVGDFLSGLLDAAYQQLPEEGLSEQPVQNLELLSTDPLQRLGRVKQLLVKGMQQEDGTAFWKLALVAPRETAAAGFLYLLEQLPAHWEEVLAHD